MIAIILIIKKVHLAYSLILGALIGGFIGGGGLTGTVNTMISGAQGMMSSVLRILTSGILAGAMIHSGATVIDSRHTAHSSTQPAVLSTWRLKTA